MDMELKTFTQMFSDKDGLNFIKLRYKYGNESLAEYIEILRDNFYQHIDLLDFAGSPVLLLPAKINITSQKVIALMQSYEGDKYGIQAMEDEIIATLSIETIDTTKESVRRILNGAAPDSDNENKAYGIKRGLDFIADISNKITEENLYKLYMLAAGDFLEENNRLIPGKKYRHDEVYVVGQNLVHQGINYRQLPEYVQNLIRFINTDDDLDQVVKSIIAHYYFAYLHPYFDGNGRMARLVQMWILLQKGYTSSLFVPFSAYINENKNLYYNAFKIVADNYKLSGVLDVTPFIVYFMDHILAPLQYRQTAGTVLEQFKAMLANGEVTEKEKDLFYFVLSAYGSQEFSSKQLEKDYQHVAYATVRSFLMKFQDRGLLVSRKFSNRVKYRVREP